MLYSKQITIRNVLAEKGIIPDIFVKGQNPEVLDYIHRSTDDQEIYFVRNTTNIPQDIDAVFRVKHKHPEFWNPQTGERVHVNNFRMEETGVRLGLNLDPLGSMFIVFKEEHTSNYISEVLKDGQLQFPLNSEKSAFTLYDGKFLAKENGNYSLQFVNGDQQEFLVNDIPEDKLLTGSWKIRFPYGWGAPQNAEFKELISWTDSENEGIRHFSGIASYHKSFEMEEEMINPEYRLILDLGKVSKMAEIFLNGKRIQTLWYSPYKVDITEAVKSGTNYLVVNIANVMSNQMTGDAKVPEHLKRTHSNITKGPNAWMHPWEDVPLIESGLLGPVSIKYSKQINIAHNE